MSARAAGTRWGQSMPEPTRESTKEFTKREPTKVQIKGQSIVAFERTVKQLKGDEAIGELLPRLPGEVAHAISSKEILAVGWYPMEWFAALHTAAGGAFGPEISREIGRAATRHDVTTIYRFILKFLSPDTLMKHYGRVFALFCESSKVIVESQQKGGAVVRCSGCDGASSGVWEDVIGTTEVILELCGAKSPAGKIMSGAGNSGAMVCQYTWS
jgi:hypothetical protein